MVLVCSKIFSFVLPLDHKYAFLPDEQTILSFVAATVSTHRVPKFAISIIIPLVISFFLHFFGKNNYEVPIFHEKRISNYSFCLQNVEFPFYVKSDSFLEIGQNFILVDIRLDDKNNRS